MSLKAIHVMVILFSIAVLIFFGFWGISNGQALQHSYFYLGVVSLLAGILLVPYLVWFIMKMRKRLNS